jgi:hypothetical protein
VGARLGSEQTKANACREVSVGGAGAWLGHVQHILAANKCTSMPTEHTWFVKHAQNEGTTCMTKKMAQRNTNAVVRNTACLGAAGAHACESGKAERRHGAKRATFNKARNPDRPEHTLCRVWNFRKSLLKSSNRRCAGNTTTFFRATHVRIGFRPVNCTS